MILFLIFLAVPLIEIGLFITVGGWISLWPTLALVVVTAIIGSAIVRFQGLGALQQIHKSVEMMQDPAQPVAHGLLIAVAGVLLITPGFFTDAIGFFFLVPVVRRVLIDLAAQRLLAPRESRFHTNRANEDIIDGDYHEIPPSDLNHQPPNSNTPRSGWTRR